MPNRYVAPFIACAAFALYVAMLSQHFSADSILLARAVESGQWLALVTPQHLLLRPLGWAFFRAWQWFGWQGSALLPLQLLNALGGAVCVGLLYRIAQHLTDSARASALTACGFAVSGGLWLLSTDAEFVTMPLAVQLCLLWCALTLTPERARRASLVVLVGIGIALGVLTYLTSVFLLPVVCVAIALQTSLPRALRVKQIALCGGAVVVTLALSGLCLAFIWSSTSDVSNLLRLFGGSGEYGQLTWRNVPAGLYAFLRSLALFPNLGMNDRTTDFLASASNSERAVFVGYYAIVFALAVAPLLCVRRAWPTHRRTFVSLSVWCALFGAFAFYWVPSDVTFWMPWLAAWWLLVALCAAQIVMPARWHTIMATSLVVLLAAANTLLIWPQHDLSRNRPYALAMQVAALSTAADLIITGADGTTFLYVEYFAHRQALPLTDAALSSAIARARARGSRVFLVDSAPNAALATNATWQRRAESVWELSP